MNVNVSVSEKESNQIVIDVMKIVIDDVIKCIKFLLLYNCGNVLSELEVV